MAGQPFLPLFVGDFLASSAEMSGEAQALYAILLMHQWSLGSLPADPVRLQALSRWSGPFIKVWAEVSSKFTDHGDRLLNLRLEEHRSRALAITEGRKQGGRLTAAKRWGIDSSAISSASSSATCSANSSAVASIPYQTREEVEKNPPSPLLTPPSALPQSPKPKTPHPPPFDPTSIQGLSLVAWGLWVGYRRSEKKQPIRNLRRAAIDMASRGDAAFQLACVEHSMVCDYQGLVAPDAKRPAGKGNGSLSNAWDQVMAVARRGEYRAGDNTHDEAIERAVSLIGGYVRIGQADTFLIRQLESRFREVYQP